VLYDHAAHSGGLGQPSLRITIDSKVLVNRRSGVARYVEGLVGTLEALEPEGVCVSLIRPSSAAHTMKWTLWDLQRASMAHLDLLHCPFYYTPLWPRCLVTLAIHDVLPLTHPEWFPRPLLSPIRWLMPRSARKAAGIVTFARTTAAAIGGILGIRADRIHVIPHGVDHGRFHAQKSEIVAATRQRWTRGRPYLLQVGALEPRRGIDLALAAMEALRGQWPDLVLLLIGGARAPIPELKHAPPWVIRPGFVPDEELPALYSGAEAVLSPSRGEGFDLPLLEALACGAAVVASDIPVHVEHFAPAVELFASGSWEALAGSLERVLGDSGRREELRRRGVEHAASFTWERSAVAHVELWREICSR